jgi:hypothetical protein
MTENWRERITLDPPVLGGKPAVRGVRISVEHVLPALSTGVPGAAAQPIDDPRVGGELSFAQVQQFGERTWR